MIKCFCFVCTVCVCLCVCVFVFCVCFVCLESNRSWIWDRRHSPCTCVPVHFQHTHTHTHKYTYTTHTHNALRSNVDDAMTVKTVVSNFPSARTLIPCAHKGAIINAFVMGLDEQIEPNRHYALIFGLHLECVYVCMCV